MAEGRDRCGGLRPGVDCHPGQTPDYLRLAPAAPLLKVA